MPACSHTEASFTNGRHHKDRCSAPRLPTSMFCDPHRLEHLATLKPVDPHQQIIRDLRWRFGVGSGVFT